MAATNKIHLRSRNAAADRPLKDLVTELGRDSGLLVRQEIELAKLEIKEYGARVAKAGIGIGTGSAVAHMGALTTQAAIVLLLVRAGVVPWLAAAMVGAATIVAGYAMIQGARRRLKAPAPVLSRTKKTTKQTVQWAKEQVP